MSLLDPERFFPLAAAFLLGALVAGGVVTLTTVTEQPGPDPANPGYGVATATGCLPPDAPVHGWVHETATRDARVVSVNLSVAHDAGRGVEAGLLVPGEREYVLRIETVPNPDDKGPAPECEHGYGSTVEFSASLPRDLVAFAVEVGDDRVFETGAPDGTTPHHWDLGGTYNATA